MASKKRAVCVARLSDNVFHCYKSEPRSEDNTRTPRPTPPSSPYLSPAAPAFTRHSFPCHGPPSLPFRPAVSL
ncbi:hypothetical protein E2C01_090525 [Portunus trituberculatus]|uniref:Uncharacterized protein n=1 Tax=Portunus trituberculatus TaxID=210409 RepID=A0A5B7JQK4_PORTR|nr:hypothetical protein [Portunus trituberculatus]